MTVDLADRLSGHQSRHTTDEVVEEAGTLELRGNHLLFSIARPSGPCRSTGIVLCHSYFELSMLQEAEIEFARKAATAGFACIYVQAPGMGDSEGIPESCTATDRVDAAVAGFDELRRRVPAVENPCFFGARFGGFIATMAGARVPGSSLVLWDPNFDPAVYWKQVRRLARVAAVVGQMRFFEDPQIELDRDGEASVLGVEATGAQLDDMISTAGALAPATVDGKALLVCIDESAARSASAHLSEVVRGGIETRSLGSRDIWHLGLRRGRGAIEPTIEWLKEGVV